jgi:hypothetical protein
MRNFILFVLERGPLLFLGAAILGLILGIVFGTGMYWFRDGSVGPRRSLKKVDLLAHVFSLVAVLAAMIPLSNLTAEFLLKIALHDKYKELGEKTSDNVRQINNFCWAKHTEDIKQECDKMFTITNLIVVRYEEGEKIPKFTPVTVLSSEIKDRETQINAEIDGYNASVEFLKNRYRNDVDEFKFSTVPLTMLAGAVAAFAIGLGFFRRVVELRLETG